MCGRFTQNYTWAQVHDFLNIMSAPQNLRPRYNIAPTTMIDIVRLDATGQRELVQARWGLIPFWSKNGPKDSYSTFNAMVETVATKPTFREAYKRRRCIVPASGFYEWTGDKKARQPWLFTAADGSPILFLAGLRETWRDKQTGEEILSATMIVTAASEWMKPYHDRMPAVLAEAEIDRWLRGDMVAEELHPAPEARFREQRVSPRINKTGAFDDDPSVIEPEKTDS
jgi:putative SOS response-associated peptidase YedK